MNMLLLIFRVMATVCLVAVRHFYLRWSLYSWKCDFEN